MNRLFAALMAILLLALPIAAFAEGETPPAETQAPVTTPEPTPVADKLIIDSWNLYDGMQNYDIEQANLNHVIAEKRNTLMEIENASVDISAWAKEFKQYTNIDKLNRKIVTKLIDSVEVHESTKENGVIKQHVTVNYKFVGQLSA